MYKNKPAFLDRFGKYCKRDFLVPNLKNYEDFKVFVNKNNVFIEKTLEGFGGENVKKVNVSQIKDLHKYYKYLLKNKMYIEQRIVQHNDMNKLCDASVNTIRIITLNNNGESRIILCCMRIGNGVNCVDNFHSRGMCINIDVENGMLKGEAIDKYGNHYKEHPITKTKLDGFKIPYFKDLIEMALNASKENDKVHVIGWDIAITENGPVLVEGNTKSDLNMIQILSNKGRVDIIEDILNEIEIDKK